MKKSQLAQIVIFSLLALLVIAPAALAQDEATLAQATSEDAVKVNILFVGAHPDDESGATATMARYVLDGGAKAAVATATRGEGGGNAIGRELGPSLGILRDYEERMSLSLLGINQLYPLGEQDWAYTTSATATELVWGYEEPLANVVRLYRVLKPDVVITMNPSPRGHGHHQYIAKLATEAFFLAGDATAFPEQIEEEFIEPWQPKKLYYALAYGSAGLAASVEIPTNELSPSQFMTYAELESIALGQYRSQGWSASLPPSSRSLRPETFTLAASVLPMPETETSLLTGIFTGVDQAPANVELEVTPAEFYVSQGGEVAVDVVFRNYSTVDLMDVSLSVAVPDGWTVTEASMPENAPVDSTVSALFTVSVPQDADVTDFQTIVGRFDAVDADGVAHYASTRGLLQITPPVSVELQPIDAVQIYREWTQRNNVEHLIRLVPAEVAIGAGETASIPVSLNNRSDADVEVTVVLTVASDAITLDASEQTVTVPAGETLTADFMATVPADMGQGSFDVTVDASYEGYALADAGTLQIVPTLSVPMIAEVPVIDGDLSEYADLPSHEIPFDRIWEGGADDAADLTATFKVAYDDAFLYVALEVVDDAVVSNIAPNDIKGHWRSDSVEITVDPHGPGASENTLTTFKTGIFPFDTERPRRWSAGPWRPAGARRRRA
jgi:LmbE family N-acetylglucosaminyl deacetylase